jgi:subtilisin family serine protease
MNQISHTYQPISASSSGWGKEGKKLVALIGEKSSSAAVVVGGISAASAAAVPEREVRPVAGWAEVGGGAPCFLAAGCSSVVGGGAGRKEPLLARVAWRVQRAETALPNGQDQWIGIGLDKALSCGPVFTKKIFWRQGTCSWSFYGALETTTRTSNAGPMQHMR